MSERGDGRRGGTVERLIALAAPGLDVLLGVGERISRIAEPNDYEYYPVRRGAELPLLSEASGSGEESDAAADPGEESDAAADPGEESDAAADPGDQDSRDSGSA